MTMKHTIDDLDVKIAQSIKDQATTNLMLKLCTIATISLAITACVIAFWLLNQ